MCCKSCAKIILITFNFLLFICGGLLVAFGALGRHDMHSLMQFWSKIPGVERIGNIIDVPATIAGSTTFMIILGSVMLFFGFFGCFGACCMLKWMLFIYWLVLVLILLAEIALIIVAAVSPGKLEGHVKEVLLKSLQTNFKPVSITGNDKKNITLPSSVVAIAWVSLQFEVGCCGANNSTDYDSFPWNKTFDVGDRKVNAIIPPSCCKLKTPHQVPKSTLAFQDLEKCLLHTSDYNDEGCYKSVLDLMVQYHYIPIIIAAAVIFVELVAIAAAYHLWKSNDRGDKF